MSCPPHTHYRMKVNHSNVLVSINIVIRIMKTVCNPILVNSMISVFVLCGVRLWYGSCDDSWHPTSKTSTILVIHMLALLSNSNCSVETHRLQPWTRWKSRKRKNGICYPFIKVVLLGKCTWKVEEEKKCKKKEKSSPLTSRRTILLHLTVSLHVCSNGFCTTWKQFQNLYNRF